MSTGLVVLLIVLWAIVLLPGAVRSRRTSAQVTVGGFERAMDVLRNRPPGREVMVPIDARRIVHRPGAAEAVVSATGRVGHLEVAEGDLAVAHREPSARERERRETTARRRSLFARMLAAAGGALLVAVVVGGALWWTLATLSVGAVAGYAALLRSWKLQRDQAAEVVRTIRTTDRRAEADRVPMPRAVGEGPLLGGHASAGGAGDVQVATRPDDPWRPHSGVRIRRWGD